jgi:Holliday junction resolvasome RuvABC endonuclease subunit
MGLVGRKRQARHGLSLKSVVSSIKETRILAIDPSSHSLAWVIYDVSSDKIVLITCGKIDYKKDKNISMKFSAIHTGLDEIVEKYSPKHAIIEQSIYVQNFETSRIISYIIGYSWGVLSGGRCTVSDVNPLTWKSGIGYKNLSKKDAEIFGDNGEKGSLQIKLKNERKKRVRDIVTKYFAEGDIGINDDDIIDAAGIGLWYATKKIQQVTNGE